MKRKMNGLYKTAFILMLVAAALFIAATIVAYALERPLLVVSHRRGCLRLSFFCHVRVPPDSLCKLFFKIKSLLLACRIPREECC